MKNPPLKYLKSHIFYSLHLSLLGNLARLNRQKNQISLAMLVLLLSVGLGSVSQAQNLPDADGTKANTVSAPPEAKDKLSNKNDYATFKDNSEYELYDYDANHWVASDAYTAAYKDHYAADPNAYAANEYATAYAIAYAAAINEGQSKEAATHAAYIYFAAKDKDAAYKDAYTKAYDKSYSGNVDKNLNGNSAHATLYANTYATLCANAYATEYAKGYAKALKENPSKVHARITAVEYGIAGGSGKAYKILAVHTVSGIIDGISDAAGANNKEKN